MLKIVNESIYSETVDNLKVCYENYERLMIENTQYTLGLANGEFLNIRIPKNQVPHLLGVLPENLKVAGIVRKELSNFDIFKKMINFDLGYYSMTNKNRGFQVSSLFSEHVDDKIEAFINNVRLRTDDIYAIVKYRKDRTYKVSEQTHNSDYFIIRYIDNKYYILGVANNSVDKTGTDYVPVTSRMYDDYSKFTEFLEEISKNQEVTYAYYFKLDNYANRFCNTFYTRFPDKKTIIERLNRLKEKYSAIPSVAGDALSNIKKLMDESKINYIKAAILGSLTDSIRNGMVLTEAKIDELLSDEQISEDVKKSLKEDLKSLINACNDRVCSEACSESSGENSYSVIESENKKLKLELEEMRKQLEEVKGQNITLTSEKEVLKQENEQSSAKLKILTTAFEEASNIGIKE